jgi:hypothetical protein
MLKSIGNLGATGKSFSNLRSECIQPRSFSASISWNVASTPQESPIDFNPILLYTIVTGNITGNNTMIAMPYPGMNFNQVDSAFLDLPE